MEKRAASSDWRPGEWAVFYTILVMALGLMIALLAAISFVGCINNWLYHCVPTTAFVDFAVIWLIPLLLTWAPPFFLFVGKVASTGLKQFIVAYAVVCFLFITFELASALYGIIVVWVPSNTSSASFSVGIFAATIIMLILFVIQIMQLFFAIALLEMPEVGWRGSAGAAARAETRMQAAVDDEELEVILRTFHDQRRPPQRRNMDANPIDDRRRQRDIAAERIVTLSTTQQ